MASKYTITKKDNTFVITEGDKSFNIRKDTDTLIVDADYFVTPTELQGIIADVRLGEALTEKPLVERRINTTIIPK